MKLVTINGVTFVKKWLRLYLLTETDKGIVMIRVRVVR